MQDRHEPPPRLALVSADSADLVAQLEAMAPAPVVRVFQDLYVDATAIHDFAPAALFVAHRAADDQDAGALRMLRSLMPDAALVLVSTPSDEVASRAIAERLGAEVVVSPSSMRDLMAAVEWALSPHTRPTADTLLDLARGISDEINNPLMFISGHLQLLERSLAEDATKLAQVHQIRDGIARVTATMERVRALARAGRIEGAEPVDIADLASQVAAKLDTIGIAQPTVPAVVRGDPDLLRTLFEQLTRVISALAAGHPPTRVSISKEPSAVRISALLDTRKLPAWQLPRTFDPYYLTRILRGTPHGLALFLVQVVARGHGGRATAQWEQPGMLRLEVELPLRR